MTQEDSFRDAVSRPMPPKKDHSGIYIFPLCMLLAALIFAPILVHDAIVRESVGHALGRGGSSGGVALGAVTAGIAGALGVGGSIALSVVLVGVATFFFVRAILRYRAVAKAAK